MDDFSDDARREAGDWWALMRGPDAAAHEDGLAAWRAAKPENDAAYRQLLIRWDQSRFGDSLDIVQSRDLSRAAPWHSRTGVRVAVAGLIAMFAVLLGYHFIVRPTPATASAIAYQSGLGEIRSIVLSDGSHVTLDSMSRIDVTISESERLITLARGTARFDVATDPRGFSVMTPRGAINANDAMFDVSATSSLTRVTVLRGKLSFVGQPERPGRGSPAATSLRQGQRIASSAADGLGKPVAAAPDASSWPSGMLSFDGERLADAIAEFNLHNRRQLVIADPGIAGLRITGAFHANDPLGFARALGGLFGLEARERPDGAIELRGKKA